MHHGEHHAAVIILNISSHKIKPTALTTPIAMPTTPTSTIVSVPHGNPCHRECHQGNITTCQMTSEAFQSGTPNQNLQ
jgi:hypothetical protein